MHSMYIFFKSNIFKNESIKLPHHLLSTFVTFQLWSSPIITRQPYLFWIPTLLERVREIGQVGSTKDIKVFDHKIYCLKSLKETVIF